MPSLTFITTIALAFLSATSVVAQRPGRPGRPAAPRRGRPNHADLYGYPHNRGAPPPGTPRLPITPGGFVDPRPPNTGAACRTNNECSTRVRNAQAVCTAGVCSFSCLGQTQLSADGQSCDGLIISARCSRDAQCPTNVANASGICLAGRCSFACADGFFAQGSTCAPAARDCGGVTCPPIAGGYSTCENNRCSAKCNAHLGFQMYCNADQTICQCTNTGNDTNNCGAPGNVCPPGYNGLGRVYCAAGQCGLSCSGGLTTVTPRGGAPYCSRL